MAITGRPNEYTQETADRVCEMIANGYSLRKVCAEENMPVASTVFKWMRENEDFSKHYAKACAERTEAQNEEMLELGDEAISLAQSVDVKASGAVVNAVRLKSDNLKWVMSKMKPKKFGDKLDLTSDGKALPTPLLAHIDAIPNNNSNSEDSGSEETH